MRKIQLRVEAIGLCILFLLSVIVSYIIFPLLYIFTGNVFLLVQYIGKLIMSKRYEEI